MVDSITSVLEDITSHHCLIGDITLLIMSIFIFYLCLKDKIKIVYAYLMHIGSLIIACYSIMNDARINEYVGWYLRDSKLYDDFMMAGYLKIAIIIAIFIMILLEIFKGIRYKLGK